MGPQTGGNSINLATALENGFEQAANMTEENILDNFEKLNNATENLGGSEFMNEMSEMMHNMTDFGGSGGKYYGHGDSTEGTHLRPEKNDSDNDKPENGIHGEGHIVINNNLNGCECGKERLDEKIIEHIVNMTIDKMQERMEAEKQKKKEKKQNKN